MYDAMTADNMTYMCLKNRHLDKCLRFTFARSRRDEARRDRARPPAPAGGARRRCGPATRETERTSGRAAMPAFVMKRR